MEKAKDKPVVDEIMAEDNAVENYDVRKDQSYIDSQDTTLDLDKYYIGAIQRQKANA
jgi:hypothetical protein